MSHACPTKLHTKFASYVCQAMPSTHGERERIDSTACMMDAPSALPAALRQLVAGERPRDVLPVLVHGARQATHTTHEAYTLASARCARGEVVRGAHTRAV